MKNVLVLFATVFVSLSIYGQKSTDVLMTVGETPVTVEEFRYIYEKNNGKKASYSQASVGEYLELYKKFKLKVEKAKELQLDTLPELKKELKGYRDQLASSYIYDKEVTEQLVKDIYERKKQDIHVRHIMIQKPGRRSRIEDNSYKRAEAAIRSLKSGMSFVEAVKKHSEDKNTKNRGGDLGYLTATLPDAYYGIEVAMYDLPVGQYSDIIESDRGYHIIEVLDRRPARGVINVAHILLKTDKSQGTDVVKKKADSLYNALKQGADWDGMLKKYSQDKKTLNKGGRLPTIGISMFARTFEDAAFSLKKDGDISMPIKTKLGYHIIKRLDKPGLPPVNQFMNEQKELVKKRERYTVAQNNYLEAVRKNAGFKSYQNVLDLFAESLDKEEFYGFKWKPDMTISDATVASFGDTKHGIKEFAEYCRKNIRRRGSLGKGYPIKDGVNTLFQEFVREKTMDYTIASVEERHPDFKSLMREYEEGILLFEITKQNVWDKANQDTIGLEKFHEGNKERYKWGKRAKVVTYTVDKAHAKKVKRYMKRAQKYPAARMLKKYNRKNKKVLSVKEDVLEEANITKSGMQCVKGYITPTAVKDKDGNLIFKMVSEVMEPTQKTLEEARGFIVADYQDRLEKEWVEELTNRYPIVVDKEVLNKLLK